MNIGLILAVILLYCEITFICGVDDVGCYRGFLCVNDNTAVAFIGGVCYCCYFGFYLSNLLDIGRIVCGRLYSCNYCSFEKGILN